MGHLLLGCVYSKEVWFKALRKFGWHAVALTVVQTPFVDWWLRARQSIRKARRKCFNSVVMLITWLQRNARVFGGHQVPPSMLAELIAQDCELWCRARLMDRLQLMGTQLSIAWCRGVVR
jgi:hypothetical protein